MTRVASLDGACGIPANARALAVNVTVMSPTALGTLVLFPGNYPSPGTSSINFGAGALLTNNTVLSLSTDGTGKYALLATVVGNGTAHAAIDVFGYFAP